MTSEILYTDLFLEYPVLITEIVQIQKRKISYLLLY